MKKREKKAPDWERELWRKEKQWNMIVNDWDMYGRYISKVILTSITTENYFGNKKTWMIEKFTDTENR